MHSLHTRVYVFVYTHTVYGIHMYTHAYVCLSTHIVYGIHTYTHAYMCLCTHILYMAYIRTHARTDWQFAYISLLALRIVITLNRVVMEFLASAWWRRRFFWVARHTKLLASRFVFWCDAKSWFGFVHNVTALTSFSVSIVCPSTGTTDWKLKGCNRWS
jgi:hypothetical protein